uniref:Kinesin motor domain-containing protein n=1 Tax=Meloidogyne hapla TaxID=6305 RepID=A0A1I8B9G3_MELHA
MSSVKVAVRVRPFNSREIHITSCSNQTYNFEFDYSYSSFDKKAVNYACQDKVYKDIGLLNRYLGLK